MWRSVTTRKSEFSTDICENKEMNGNRQLTKSLVIKDAQRNVIMHQEEVPSRWEQYTTSLCNDVRINRPHLQDELNGPIILKEEVENAI